ncbi:MAG: hypothetical protein CFE25_14420 [Chitinophagaceae bacterium BSSC1]|nr:MAG: hypothetical protein CFE25_14420 [Chitinophagaceae bacterium BSSC1]
MKKRIIFLMLVCSFFVRANAQDDLLGDLVKEDASKVKQNLTTATFKSSRIINFTSVEMTGKGNLQFMISHRFGQMWKEGKGWSNVAQLFGLNSGFANTYMSFDYSFTDWMNLGFATTGNAQFESWAKFKLLKQQTGQKNIPVSVAFYSLMHADASEGPSPDDLTWNRFSYLNQLLIARKFSESFSLQLIPSFIHYNYVPYGINNTNNIFSIALGGRMKLTNKTAITFEYSRQLNGYKNLLDESASAVNYKPDVVSIGYDWDTGGHIFQFFLSSASSATNIGQLSANQNELKPGNFSLGFNLNRSYGIKKVVQTH